MAEEGEPKPLVWVGSSHREFCEFPRDVRRHMGFALYIAQVGDKHPAAKPLRGFGGASVLEIIDAFDGDAFRCVYTVQIVGVVYVLHAFQKKSKQGIATPRAEIETIQRRLRIVRQRTPEGPDE